MARIESTWDEILLRLLARLTAQVSEATDDTAIISSNPDELPPNPGGDYFFVLSPPPSWSFTEQYEGGESEQCQTHTTFIVTVWSTIQRDSVGRAKELFTNADRGLFVAATSVLKAFLGHDLQNADGTDEILNDPIHPSNMSWKRDDRAKASIQIAFDIKFDWDLS